MLRNNQILSAINILIILLYLQLFQKTTKTFNARTVNIYMSLAASSLHQWSISPFSMLKISASLLSLLLDSTESNSLVIEKPTVMSIRQVEYFLGCEGIPNVVAQKWRKGCSLSQGLTHCL